jgi:phosphoribosylamine--glycine ligase
MKILVIGSGGREHAIAWKLGLSNRCEKLYIAPGNSGTSLVGENVNLDISDFGKVGRFVMEHQIDMVVVGPEDPLVKGFADYFAANPTFQNVMVIGPCQKGAMLEGSKDFAKEFMQRHGIPTAKYQTFTKDSIVEARKFLSTMQPPYVIKADGLAAGKGVVICNSIEEANSELDEMLLKERFGQSSAKVVIEEFLTGIEISVFAITDGKSYCLLPSAKDYKRIGEGDTGPNTGGMGAVSPVPFATSDFMSKVESLIVAPTVNGLANEGISYTGFLFFGLISVKGDPYVIEYNVRLGDPETEAIIPLIESDLVSLFESAAKGNLSQSQVSISPLHSATVVIASGGYPGDFEKGIEITCLNKIEESLVFHAGMSRKADKLVTSGGRVVAITSLAPTLAEALEKSFASAEKVEFDKKYFRKDIGSDLLDK